MDDPALDASRHREALSGLRRINAISGSARHLLDSIVANVAGRRGEPMCVLDLATGGGDIPLRLWRAARNRGVPLTIDACDVSGRAVRHAHAEANREQIPVGFFRLDALREPLPTGYDVVMNSLFLHHLEAEQAVDLLARMGVAANDLVLVSDLRRSAGGLAAAWLATRLLSRSDVVRTDGPRSVRAAFTAAEARSLADAAGLQNASIRPHWPFRYVLTWRRR